MPFQKGHGVINGRPKGSIGKSRIESNKALEYIRERVTAELGPILDKQIIQAKDGDGNARRDLYDRAYGKPKESVEIMGGVTVRLNII